MVRVLLHDSGTCITNKRLANVVIVSLASVLKSFVARAAEKTSFGPRLGSGEDLFSAHPDCRKADKIMHRKSMVWTRILIVCPRRPSPYFFREKMAEKEKEDPQYADEDFRHSTKPHVSCSIPLPKRVRASILKSNGKQRGRPLRQGVHEPTLPDMCP